MILYYLTFVFFGIGLYGIIRKRNVIKMIMGVIICEYAANLFFVLIGYRTGGRAPILSKDITIEKMVDPLPQAVVLTTIVIGLATTILLVTLAIRIYQRFGTFDITKIKELEG